MGDRVTVKLGPISVEDAKAYFLQHSAFRGSFNLAIAAREGDIVHGVIAFECDGFQATKRQISTDGNAQIGSLLYGAAVRAAMALGYGALHFGE